MKRCQTCGSEFAADALYCQWDGTPLAESEEGPDPYLGQVLAGQVEILGAIGQGGMGTVYRGLQRGFDRPVAVKILHPDLARNPEVLARFNREARIASRLDHPNIVHVYLFGQLPDGNLYLVMEFLDGRSLLDVLRFDGPLETRRALHIAEQICSALGEAHDAGIIHRDLKPENIMLVRRGSDAEFVKILDFGIAKFVQSEGGTGDVQTQAGLVFGTARYISPEGASGDPVDSRSDVYSLGIVLYQMLSGRVPFLSDNPVSLLLMHINDPPPPLRSHPDAAGIHPAIEAVVMRALEKSPMRRHANAREFGDALIEAAMHSGVSVARSTKRHTTARPSEAPDLGRAQRDRVGTPPTFEPVALPPQVRTLEWSGQGGGGAPYSSNVLPGPENASVPPTRLQPVVRIEELNAAQSVDVSSSGSITRPPAGAISTSMDPVRLPGSRAPLFLVLGAVVLIGGGIAALVLLKPGSGVEPGGDLLPAAEHALLAGRMSSASGDGAVDFLLLASRERPGDSRVSELRARILEKLRLNAGQAQREGRLTDARQALLDLLRVEPADTQAVVALAQTESVMRAHQRIPDASAPEQTAPDAGAPAAPVARGVQVSSDPAIAGRPVRLVARLSGPLPQPESIRSPHFHVKRRGAAGVEVPASSQDEPGTFAAQHRFARGGTYEISFFVTIADERAEGQLTLEVRPSGAGGGTFTTGGGGESPLDPPPIDPPPHDPTVPPPPPPPPDGRWM